MPEGPEVAEVLEIHEIPEVSEVPLEITEIPEILEIPETPEVPEIPELPEKWVHHFGLASGNYPRLICISVNFAIIGIMLYRLVACCTCLTCQYSVILSPSFSPSFPPTPPTTDEIIAARKKKEHEKKMGSIKIQKSGTDKKIK